MIFILKDCLVEIEITLLFMTSTMTSDKKDWLRISFVSNWYILLQLYLTHLPAEQNICIRNSAGTAPRGGILGPCPPNHCLCPPNENCVPPSEDSAPNKLTGSVLLECNSRPETPEILVITQEFVSKNCVFRRFCNDTVCFCGFTPEFMKSCEYIGTKTFLFFFFFLGLHLSVRGITHWTPFSFGPHSRIQIHNVFVPPQIYLCPPPPQLRYPGA